MILGMRETVVLLHGFAGTGRGWDPVVAELDGERYTALAPDLRGHGSRSEARPVSFDAVTGDLLAAAPPRFELCGYSMGGRIALHVALAAPERVTRLILVATTAGIDDSDERAARRAADDALAASIEALGVEAFATRWLAQPLFAGDPPAVQDRARADIARNEPGGLAAALRGIGTGSMTPLWDRLSELAMPALVLAGEQDARFTAIGRRLTDALPDAELVLVPGAGHALVRAAPVAVAGAINAA
jgi:2-succinyl-6-hydroxy-2,4-cyclohexadiene-1-carboxylate synthase